MVVGDMECLQVAVGATTLSMHERFTMLAEMSPFQKAAPLRTRRMSTNEGPLFSSNLRAMQSHQDIVDDVVQQLGLDWRVQELQQDERSRAGSMPRSRAGSMPRSRAGSMSRDGSEHDIVFSHVRPNSRGNLSPANSVGNLSQRSGRSGRSNGGQGFRQFRGMPFKGPNLNQRLQMRNAWMRRRNMRFRGRGRGRGNYNHRNQYQQQGRWNNPLRRQWGWQQGRQPWWRQQWGRQQGGMMRRWGYARSEMPPLTPRGRAGQEPSGYNQKRGGAGCGRGRGRGRGRGAQNTGVSHSDMPALKTREQLDKELEEYMASTPALLDKQLDEYMAQSGLSMDTD